MTNKKIFTLFIEGYIKILGFYEYFIMAQVTENVGNLMTQTLFWNPIGPVELGNPNTCAETKLCLILFYSGSRSSLLQA